MPKSVKIGPGKGVRCKGQMWLFFALFFIFLQNFLPDSGDHIFASIDTVFAPDNGFRWGLIS